MQTAVHTSAEVDTSLLTIVYIMSSIATRQSSTHTDVQVYNHKVLSILWIPLPLLHNLQHTLWLMFKYKVLCVFQDMHEAAFLNPIKWSTWLYTCTESLANISSLKGRSALSAFSPPHQPRCPPIKGDLIPHQGKIRLRSKKLDQ